MIVFDTDVLSTFAKVNKLNLLFELFNGNELFYTPSVKLDLQRAQEKDYGFVERIFNYRFKIIPLSKKETESANKIGIRRKDLHRGEIESLALCKLRNYIFVSNDKRALKVAESLEITCLSLSDILRSFITENILTISETEQLIKEIELKDRVKITDKERILK